MNRILLLFSSFLAVVMTACGGAGNVPATGSGNNVGAEGGSGSGGTNATSGCGSMIIWGGNTNAAPSSGASDFQPTGSMTQPRAGHTATRLSDGTVLIVDGGQLDIDDLLVSIPSAEVFDPSQGKFSAVGNPCIAREFHTATLLKNGKVLIAGGTEFAGYPTWLPSTASAELYDPGSRSFAGTNAMQTARTQHSATLLADGRVLIAGGSTSTDTLASAELYDPAKEMFVAAASMQSPRIGHTATMLQSGKVLIVGGENAGGALDSAELYDPATNAFSSAGRMNTPRSGQTATLLPDGKVLICGGESRPIFSSGLLRPNTSPLASAELYDPVTGKFSLTGTMTTIRIAHTATLLSNGKVLISGGYLEWVDPAGYRSSSSAELYDPLSGTFTPTDPMNVTRLWHSATLLSDGSVLITGGIGEDWTLASAEIYKD